MKKKYKIVICSKNLTSLISRFLVIFNRKNLKLLKLKVVFEEKLYKHILEFLCQEEKIAKVLINIDTQIGVISTVFYEIKKENIDRLHKQYQIFL